MIPRFRPDLTLHDLKRLARAGTAVIEDWEALFARSRRYQDAVWFPYARVGIRAYLECLESPATQVALSPFNCIALGNAIAAAGWSPRYVDVEKGGFNQDPDKFFAALSDPAVGAGILVSLWGIPPHADLEAITAKPILHDYALRTLDPATPRLQSRDAVVYSFGWGKPFTSLRGAMLCGNDKELSSRWRRWRNRLAQPASQWRECLKGWALLMAFHPRLFRWVSQHAAETALGRAFLGREMGTGLMPGDANRSASSSATSFAMDRWTRMEALANERASQLQRYRHALVPLEDEDFRLPPDVPWLSHFPIRVTERAALRATLLRQGIFTSHQLFDSLLCDFPAFSAERDQFPRARELTRTTLHLPLYSGLPRDAQQSVIEAVLAWREHTRKPLSRALGSATR